MSTAVRCMDISRKFPLRLSLFHYETFLLRVQDDDIKYHVGIALSCNRTGIVLSKFKWVSALIFAKALEPPQNVRAEDE